MLDLDDPRWKQLKGGYRLPVDVALLKALEAGQNSWKDLWGDLHHQGDVDEGSYAAVPHLVRIARAMPARDWNFYGLVSTIEVERHRRTNPKLPSWLAASYEAAWRDLEALGLADLPRTNDPQTVQTILAALCPEPESGASRSDSF